MSRIRFEVVIKRVGKEFWPEFPLEEMLNSDGLQFFKTVVPSIICFGRSEKVSICSDLTMKRCSGLKLKNSHEMVADVYKDLVDPNCKLNTPNITKY